MERKEEHQQHNTDKTWNCCIFSGQNPIDFLTADALPACLRLYYRFLAHLFDEIKTHIRNRRTAIEPTLFFHLYNQMFNCFVLILVQFQFLQNQMIPFNDLRSCKTQRNSRMLCVILDQMADCMNTAVHGSTKLIFTTEILSSRPLLIFCDMQCMPYQFIHSLIFCSRNRDHRHTQHRFHPVYIHRS